MKRLRALDGGPVHPLATDLACDAARGELDRRAFVRSAAWLGVTVASASAFVGLPSCAPDAGPPSKDRLRFVCAVQQITDPALTAWVEASNLFRNSLEFLTDVDADDITHPYLAASWRPSEDLKTWRFDLRRDVRWSNGDHFDVDDVAFNFARWLARESQSVNRTSFAAVEGFERLGPFAFALHLRRPVCSMPEQLNAFTCAIVHRRFEAEGADWPKNPVGTGPFTLAGYEVGRSAKFRRRAGYWGPPARLQEIDYLDLGPDVATHVAALAAGQADVLYHVTIAELDLVRRLPGVKLLSARAAQTLVMRMKLDHPPFDDVRVRRAVTLAADNAKMLRFAYRGEGVLGDDSHVAPFQPDGELMAAPRRDVAEARRLLAAAGHADGLDLTLTLGNTQGRWEQDTAQVLQQSCAEAGLRIRLNVVPPAEYWSIWNKIPFGLTYWSHRPLGVMLYDIAYRSGGVWNESGFADARFDSALDDAMAVADPRLRAKALIRARTILRDAAVVVQPYWPKKFTAVSDRVVGHRVHPSDYFRMDRVALA